MTFNAGIEAAARELEQSYPDNANTNAFCAAIRSITRPSSSAPVEHREAVARIIDPDAFAFLESHASYVAPETVSGNPERKAALAKADAILSLPGSSRDEVLEKLHAFVVEHYANQDMNHMDFRVEAYVIAAALEQSKEK